MRGRRWAVAVAVGLCLCGAVLPASRATSTEDRYFLLHVDAYFPDSRDTCSGTWQTTLVTCRGPGSTNADALGFRAKTVLIDWNRANRDDENAHPGYTREVHICVREGAVCKENLVGLAVMPNGPLSIQRGTVDGRTVVADNGNQTQIGKPGGPLHLYVGFHGDENYRGIKEYGYVFRFNGYLNLK